MYNQTKKSHIFVEKQITKSNLKFYSKFYSVLSKTNQTTKMQSSNAQKYIKTSDWDVTANRYMQPRVSDRGLKMISIISNQRNKKLHLQIPATKCWGIEDYVDPATQESDGKYKLKLHFSQNGEQGSYDALEKLQAFENKLIDDAVVNSEAWLGKKLSRELVEDRYTSFLKVGRNKETKEPDPSKGYYFSPKVNCYNGKWDLEIFDIDTQSMVFPTEETIDRTPVDYVAKGSDVITGIECKYIWVGAKGWGVTWALKQCAVKPKEIEVMEGLLQLDLGPKSANAASKAVAPAPSKPVVSTVQETDDVEEVEEEKVTPAPAPASTPTKEPMVDNYVEDSDTEEVAPVATAAAAETQEEEEPEKVEEEEEPAPVAKKVVKKSVVKKAPAKEEADATATEEEAKPAPKVVKKVVRKKA